MSGEEEQRPECLYCSSKNMYLYDHHGKVIGRFANDEEYHLFDKLFVLEQYNDDDTVITVLRCGTCGKEANELRLLYAKKIFWNIIATDSVITATELINLKRYGMISIVSSHDDMLKNNYVLATHNKHVEVKKYDICPECLNPKEFCICDEQQTDEEEENYEDVYFYDDYHDGDIDVNDEDDVDYN